ncbi:rho GTPase-activating protein 20 isoform X2 [Astyanax mexicanus]|uniref:rho GTPase-activating protein 20 isoform X2 n=1 Tax=Astyanax mexicanus TaxID=7994 RepID=UPI0020CAC79F|nr:rho GTPase-activating protein 20 isoform X2 [Astyanax mexicanus]
MEPVYGSRSRALSCGEFCHSNNVKPFSQRRLSAPSLLLNKALTKTSPASNECVSDISPASCAMMQSLLGPRRKLVCHGVAQLQAGLQTQERYLFLFSDIFIISKAKSSSQVKQKACVRLCDMWTASCLEDVCEGTTSPDTSFVIGWPTYNCVATFRTAYQKERWLSLLQSHIREEKELDHPKVIPLKIYAKDTGHCAHAKALSVRNTDCTSDVIKAALQRFGLPGSLKDFQLWVNSSMDEAPYPLIGHEFPYSIKMSHIRALQQNTAETQHQHQMAVLSDDSHCQFILKPRRTDHPHRLTEEQRSRRKVLLLTWPFRRSSTVELDGPFQSSFSPDSAPGQLFGKPLSEITAGHTLPTPIKDMLICLCNEGAATCGIFRRSAGVKACRELRRKLDSGNPDMSQESALVIAAVFKEFLRNISGSVLCEHLYDQWLKAVESPVKRGNVQDEERETQKGRVQEMQRLVQLLPEENRLLLKHTIAMLHCVQNHSDVNQMNSSNLAVCIAPSLLWSNSSLTQREDTKKVCDLVCFLIDNCHSVFGEDITALTELSLDSGGTFNSGSLRHMSDSCYDSLENELNAELEDISSTQRIKGNTLSRDSLISLSDCDLDQSEPDAKLDPLPLARIRTFTPAVRQPRPHKSRSKSSSEPALVGNAFSSLGRGHEARKASLDSSILRDELKDEFDQEDVFLDNGFRNLQMDYRGVRVSNHRQQNQPQMRLDPTGSSLSSSVTSSSSISSMDSSLDSVFSQSIDFSGPYSDLLASTQAFSPKRQSNGLLQKNLQSIAQENLSKGNQRLSQEPDINSTSGGFCVKHLSCRASKPPSYQEALKSLNRSPPTQISTNSRTNTNQLLPTQTYLHASSILPLHGGKDLFYRGPTMEPQNPSNLQTVSTNPFEMAIHSSNGTPNLDPQTASEVPPPQSVFFGQSCRLMMQISRPLFQATKPGPSVSLSERTNGQGSYFSPRDNFQNCFLKAASNRLSAVRRLEEHTSGPYSGKWCEDQKLRLHPEESYV